MLRYMEVIKVEMTFGTSRRIGGRKVCAFGKAQAPSGIARPVMRASPILRVSRTGKEPRRSRAKSRLRHWRRRTDYA
jgi:hypothetical protein